MQNNAKLLRLARLLNLPTGNPDIITRGLTLRLNFGGNITWDEKKRKLCVEWRGWYTYAAPSLAGIEKAIARCQLSETRRLDRLAGHRIFALAA